MEPNIKGSKLKKFKVKGQNGKIKSKIKILEVKSIL